MKRKSVSRSGIPAKRYSSGIGFVIIPSNVSREEFVQRCYNTHTLSILTEQNEILHNIEISPYDLEKVNFPSGNKTLGSKVFWVNIPIKNVPVVLSILGKRDEMSHLKEGQVQMRTASDSSLAEIVGFDDGRLFINVQALNANGGKLNIDVQNQNDQAELNIAVKGSVGVKAVNAIMKFRDGFAIQVTDPKNEQPTVMMYRRGEGFFYVDEFLNKIIFNEDNIQIKAKERINLGEGTESIILGNKLKAFLDDFISLVSQATVTTALGVMPLMNAAQIVQLRAKTKILLSKYSFTD